MKDLLLRQSAGICFRTPRDGFGVDGGVEDFRGIWLGYIGFSRREVFIGERASQSSNQGAHTMGQARARGRPRLGPGVAALMIFFDSSSDFCVGT